jgi:anti-sigma regulatory factor (Ser/Thr protein kinase)
VLEYPIISKDFDFIGFNTQIEEFGRKHRISQRTIYNIQAYVEEMCVQIILPQMKDSFELLVTIEYSEEKDDADVLIRYNGAAFDPMQTDNELSLLLAKKATAEIVYQYDPEKNLCNTVSAQI